MAEGNDPGTTPPVPVNPYVGGGFEQNIDQQKGFQNDLIAQQGQGVRALYDRTGASAQDVLQSQLSAAGGNPTARTALFQAYVDDAKAGEARSAQSVQRQAALGNMFMDQTKAAIPLYAKNVDATTEAMRLQFEERRRKEEENYQLQRAQLAASSAKNIEKNIEKTQQELIDEAVANRDVKVGAARSILERSGVPKTQWSVSDVISGAYSKPRTSYDDAMSVLGVPTETKESWLRNKTAVDIAQSTVDELFDDKQTTFERLKGVMQSLIDGGSVPQVTAYAVLVANAPRWGLSTEDVFGLGINSDAVRGAYR